MLFTAWVREATGPPGSSQEPGSIHASVVQSSGGKGVQCGRLWCLPGEGGGTNTAASAWRVARRGGPGVACEGPGSGAGTLAIQDKAPPPPHSAAAALVPGLLTFFEAICSKFGGVGLGSTRQPASTTVPRALASPRRSIFLGHAQK